MILCNEHIICNTMNASLIENIPNVFPNFVSYAHHCVSSKSQKTMYFCKWIQIKHGITVRTVRCFKYSCSQTYPTVDISMTKLDMFVLGQYVRWSTGLLWSNASFYRVTQRHTESN